jgi:nitroimidazol reductase NimA-like FMN-containing flavoprotein (pyridoxamine 5'-phosphate oxidase superfamily)
MDGFEPRRPKQVVSDQERLRAMLDEAQYGFLGMCREGEPYVVPVAFAREGDTVFLHSARAGKKVAFLQANGRVCLTALPRAPRFVFERDNFSYDSVIVYGEAEFIEDLAAKRQAYVALNRKYKGTTDAPGDTCISRSAIIAIRIRQVTGKRSALDL